MISTRARRVRYSVTLLALMLISYVSAASADNGGATITISDGPSKTTGNGIITINLKFTDAGGTEHDVPIPVNVKDGQTADKIAENVEKELEKNSTIKDSFTVSTTTVTDPDTHKQKQVVTATPKKGVTGVKCTKPKALGVKDVGVAGGVDPLHGIAFFDVFRTASGLDRGDVTIGIEGKTVSTSTTMMVGSMTVEKDAMTIKEDLLSGLTGAGFAQAYLDASTGEITVPDVSTGDPIGTSGVDVGAFFESTDLDVGGSCEASVVPEPPSFLLFGIGVLVPLSCAWRRRKKAA